MDSCVPGESGVCLVCGEVPQAKCFASSGLEPLRALKPSISALTDQSPDLFSRLMSFAHAAASHVAAGMPMCDKAEIIRRHDICLACAHLVNNACSLCGCGVSRVPGFVSKLSWADQECPAGKWGKATQAITPPPAD